MITSRRFQAQSASVPAGQQKDFVLPYTCPEGYTLLAVERFSTGHGQAMPVEVSPTKIIVYNVAGSAIQTAPSVVVAFIKSSLSGGYLE